MVHSAQTVHLYCTDSKTVSKRTEMRFHMTHSPRSSIGCVQDDFWADGTFNSNRAPFLRQDYHYLQTDSNKLPLEPHHLRVSSGTSKMNSEPMVRYFKPSTYIAAAVTLSPNGPKRDSTWLTLLGLQSGAFNTISEPMVRLAQTAHLSWV
jgi:hypothetical protein